MCFLCDFCCFCFKSRKSQLKKTKSSSAAQSAQGMRSLGSSVSQTASQDRRVSQAVILASSPTRMPTTDITNVYELPNKEFQTEEDVVRAHGYELMTSEILGSGSYATVYKAKRLDDQSIVACKVMDIKASKMKYDAKHELFVLEKTSHPHIIRIFKHFIVKVQNRDTNRVYLFMAYAHNNSLSHYMRSRTTGLEESTAQRMFAQMVSAVAHMHHLGIAHKDLKLGNILLDSDMNALVSDFGLSRVAFRLSKGGTVMSNQYTGTVPYMAPEILIIRLKVSHQYNPFPADIWALGVILFAMVNRAYPFGTEKETPQKIHRNQYNFNESNIPLNRYSKPSQEYVNVIKRIFTYDCDQRIDIKELIQHKWISNEIKLINERISGAQHSTE